MAHSQSTDSLAEAASIPTSRPQVQEVGRVAVFYLLLWGLNAARAFLIYPWEARLSASGQFGDVVATLVEIVLKAIIWIGLTFAVVHFVEKREFLATVWLKGNVGMGVFVGVAISVFYVVVVVMEKSLHVPNSSLFTMVPIACAGLIEEIPFRGYLLQKFQGWKMPWLGMLALNAALFTLMHVPIWMVQGTLTVQASFTIFFLGFFWCGMSLASKSVWAGVIGHTVWNVLQIFVGAVGV